MKKDHEAEMALHRTRPQASPTVPSGSPWVTAVAGSAPPGSQHHGQLRHWVLGICLSGSCEHGRPGQGRFPVEAEDVVGIRPGTPQHWRVTGSQPWEVISIVFEPRPHWLPWLDWRDVVPGFLCLRPAPALQAPIRQAFASALASSQSGASDACDLAGNALERALLLARQGWRRLERTIDPRIQELIDVMAGSLSRDHDLGQLVRSSGLSRAQLLRLFKQQIGSSPMAYLASLRLQRASQLLQQSDLPIKQVARAIGMLDQSAFSAWFHRHAGETPRLHRHRAQRMDR